MGLSVHHGEYPPASAVWKDMRDDWIWEGVSGALVGCLVCNLHGCEKKIQGGCVDWELSDFVQGEPGGW